MRKLFAAFVPALLSMSVQVSAFDVTPEYTFRAVVKKFDDAHQGQQIYCTKLTGNAGKQCREDFESFIDAMAEFGSRQTLYLLAVKKGDHKEIARLTKERDQASGRASAIGKRIEDAYIQQAVTK